MSTKNHRRLLDGVLPSQDIRQLITNGYVDAPKSAIQESQIQPASLDLRLGDVAYRVQASFVPQNRSVERGISDAGLVMARLDLTQPTVFEKGCVYIVPLREHLHLPKNLSARANPKSSTGRLDIFTRLITDYGQEFEQVPEGYRGPLYAEIASRTFSVLLRSGMTLNQLRFVQGRPKPSDRATAALEKAELQQDQALVYRQEGSPANARITDQSVLLSVSLDAGIDSEVVAYKAKRDAPLIDLAQINHHDPKDFWEPSRQLKNNRLILQPGDFYILASKERFSVPPTWAAEMVAIDHRIGEFRAHYAGFFDPGFGYGNDTKGTRAVLEVRAHEVPFLIEDGQVLGRLQYLPLLSEPDKLYGTQIGSSYQSQGLTLSKHFKRSTLMYKPSETVKLITTQLMGSTDGRDIRDAANAGDRSASNVIDSYKILLDRRDQVAESFFVAAYDAYRLRKNPESPIPQETREWIHADHEARRQSEYQVLPANSSPTPWRTDKDMVHGANGKEFIAGPIYSHPMFEKIEPSPEQLREATANAETIAEAPATIKSLHNAQVTLLEQLNQIASGKQPKSAALLHYASTLEHVESMFKKEFATPGTWTYDPKRFLLSAKIGDSAPIEIAFLASTTQYNSPQELRTIQANAQIITTPAALHLGLTAKAMRQAATQLDQGQPRNAFDKLHESALANDQVLRQASGQSLNPLDVKPIPGTPGFEQWIRSNLDIISTAEKTIPNYMGSSAPDTQSGIYRGVIHAVTNDCYLQMPSESTVVVHSKGSFQEPLEPGRSYRIHYNQGKATAREVNTQESVFQPRDR